MPESKKSIWFAGTAGWFECDSKNGLIKVDISDPRVVKAKELGVKILIGETDSAIIVDSSVVKKLESEVADLTSKLATSDTEKGTLQKDLENYRGLATSKAVQFDDLTRELAAEKAKPAPVASAASAPKESFLSTQFKAHPWGTGLGVGIPSFLLLILLVCGFLYLFQGPNGKVASLQKDLATSQTETAKANSDKAKAEGEAKTAKGLQAEAEKSRDAALGQVGPLKKELADAKEAKANAEAKLAEAQGTGRPTAIVGPIASEVPNKPAALDEQPCSPHMKPAGKFGCLKSDW